MQSAVGSNEPFRHKHWEPNVVLAQRPDYWKHMSRTVVMTVLCSFLSLGVTLWSGWRLAQTLTKPVYMVAVDPAGWVSGGVPVPFVATDEQNRYIWQQIIEAAYTRANTGPVALAKSFITEDTLALISKRTARPGDSAFSAMFSVVESRVIDQSSTAAIVGFRARLSVADAESTVSEEVFVAGAFRRGQPSEINPLGWYLAGAGDITRAEFFSKEGQEHRKWLFGDGSGAAAPQTAPAPEKKPEP